MNNKHFFTSLIMAALAVQLSGCGNTADYAVNDAEESESSVQTEKADETEEISEITDETEPVRLSEINTASPVEYSDKELTYEWDKNCTKITADNSGFSVSGSGAQAEGNILSITSEGTYYISGSINDGKIVVDTQDKKAVRLVMGGLDISCSDDVPINVKAADKLIITLENDTENKVSGSVSEGEDMPSGVIFSKSDLSFNGNGTLLVNAASGDGIVSKDKLKIVSGNIEVSAADDGFVGRDLFALRDGNLKITSGGDGIKSTNSDDPEKGNVVIEGGTVVITAGGGYENGREHHDDMFGGRGGFGKFGQQSDNVQEQEETTESMKGIKSVNSLIINDGKIKINSADDSLHANNTVEINGGTVAAESGDDGIHSEGGISVNAGIVNINKSYEGIEGSTVTVNNGSIHLRADDDGFNISSSDRSAELMLRINGGDIYVYADGDGLDSNGDIEINGGVTIVNGPTDDFNGPLDCGDNNNEIIINGGVLIAAGSTGMFEVPSEKSTQNVVTSSLLDAEAETLCTLTDEQGNVITAFKPAKKAAGIVISTPEIKTGVTYKLYTGGTYSGTLNDEGYASGGTVTGGTEITSFEVSSSLTVHGNIMQGFGGFGGGRKDFNRDFADGERPEMPDRDFQGFGNGMKPDIDFSKFADGEMPEPPEGGFPDFENGQIPEPPEGFSEQDKPDSK